jgi:hypothetical protein
MILMHYDPRTRPVPPELRKLVVRVLHERGARLAAAALGISRHTVTAIAAGSPALPGTIALLREAASRGFHPVEGAP